MKSEIFCLVLMFLCVGCFSSKSSIQQDSRFKSAELKQEISYLIPLLKRSQTSPDEISIRILITPEFIYPQILSMNCKTGEYYFFEENFDGCLIPMYINAVSHEPKRYFDLKDAKLIERDNEAQICDDWYWVKGKYKVVNDELKLIKISSFYDNSYSRKSFYDKEDSIFLHQTEVLMVEPSPEPEP